MSAVFWFGLATLAWWGVCVGVLWLIAPAAACSLFGAVDLWHALAGPDEED